MAGRPGIHVGIPVQIFANGVGPVVFTCRVAHPGGDQIKLAVTVHIVHGQAQAGIRRAKGAFDLFGVGPPIAAIAIGIQIPAHPVIALVYIRRVVDPAKEHLRPAVAAHVDNVQSSALGTRTHMAGDIFLLSTATAVLAIGSQVPADAVVGAVLARWVVNPGDHQLGGVIAIQFGHGRAKP